MIKSVLLILIAVVMLVAFWKVYVKAGKPGWAVLIPIYDALILLQIVGKPWWWIILFIIPGAGIVFGIWATNLLAKSFGKDAGFTIGLVLLPFIFVPVLGFGSAEYKGPSGK